MTRLASMDLGAASPLGAADITIRHPLEGARAEGFPKFSVASASKGPAPPGERCGVGAC